MSDGTIKRVYNSIVGCGGKSVSDETNVPSTTTETADINKIDEEKALEEAIKAYFESHEEQIKEVEITMDNWQDYFEIRPSTNGALYNAFDEFERLDYVCWAIFLKPEIAHKVRKVENAAIEFNFTDGYLSWFEYNLDTEEFVQKSPATYKEAGLDYAYTIDDAHQDFSLYFDLHNEVMILEGLSDECGKTGRFLAFIHKHFSESINDNIYSFIGEAYKTMEITRIKGTLSIAE